MARGIPIYCLDVNRPILERLLSAKHSSYPDLLEKNYKRPVLNIVSSKRALGTGVNRLKLFPMRTETGERMMMVYAPEHQLLYASDLVQKSLNGSFFMPQYLSEVTKAAAREGLAVQNVFAMHTALTPWSEVIAEVAKQIDGK